MGIRIRFAETTEDLDALFRLRHRVYVDEKGWFPVQRDGRVTDRFDAYPNKVNVIAVVEGAVVGGVRFVESSSVGVPADYFFDFSPFLPADARTGSASLLCLEPNLRKTGGLVSSMFGMGYHWALGRDLTHLVGPFNPLVAPAFLATGVRPVAPEFIHEESGLPVVPAIFPLAELDERFLVFARRQGIVHFLQSFEREFYLAGEAVVRQGDAGDAMYVVVEGEVAVTVGPEDKPTEVARLGRGEVFGEIALITSRPRSASVMAVTDVDLMVLDRHVFRQELQRDPEVAMRLLEIMGTRLADLDTRLAGLSATEPG
jgi:cyclic nucleotide-binding protein/N-acyl amino acid synthase FeeM